MVEFYWKATPLSANEDAEGIEGFLVGYQEERGKPKQQWSGKLHIPLERGTS